MKLKVCINDETRAIIEVEGGDLLDCLQKLHERLNDVANPRAAQLLPTRFPATTTPIWDGNTWTTPICSQAGIDYHISC